MHSKHDLQDGFGLGEVGPKIIFKRGARRLVTILCGAASWKGGLMLSQQHATVGSVSHR